MHRLLHLAPFSGFVCGLARTAKALVVRAFFSRLKREAKLTQSRRKQKQKRPTEQTWTDHAGKRWKVPQIKDRLRVHQIAGHAALKAHVVCRDGGKCKRCGSCDDLVVDHVVSRRNGGTHHPDNLQALCKPCNDSKSNYEDRGRQPSPCGQLSFQGLSCARTAGHSGMHCAIPETRVIQ